MSLEPEEPKTQHCPGSSLYCSLEEDYDSCLRDLTAALMRRGHPKSEFVPYDSQRRRGMIDSLRSRDRFQPALKANKNGNLIVFKVEFGPHLKSLEIRERCRNLYCSLRHIYGQTFLQDERIILAHPVRTNMFLKYYRMSFVL